MTVPATVTETLASTYVLSSVAAFVDSVADRMLADGLVLADVRAARGEIASWEEWGAFWARRADEHEAHGGVALAAASRLTAGAHFARASLAAHYGQFLLFDRPDEKRALAERKRDLFGRAAPLLDPPAQPLEIPWRDTSLPAYVRRPHAAGTACAILVGGLDAAKEDAFQVSQLLVERGVSTLAVDLPGQGESYLRGTRFDETAIPALSAVVGVALAEVAPTVALVGRSLGGFLAVRAAAGDERVRCCADWGGPYDLRGFEAKPPLLRAGYRYVTRAASEEDALRVLAFVDLTGVGERLTCPLLVVHGARDNSVPIAHARRIAAEARGPATLVVGERSIHCNHDEAHVVRPLIADWVARELGAAGAA